MSDKPIASSLLRQEGPQQEEIAVGQVWSAPDGRQLRVAGLSESQARIAMRNVESNRLSYMDRANFDASQKWHLTRVSPSPELPSPQQEQCAVCRVYRQSNRRILKRFGWDVSDGALAGDPFPSPQLHHPDLPGLMCDDRSAFEHYIVHLQARIDVLEGSIDYLRNVIDHPVKQEKTTKI